MLCIIYKFIYFLMLPKSLYSINDREYLITLLIVAESYVLDYLSKEENTMERIIHPQSGETGFFCTPAEKGIIDAILMNFISSSKSGDDLLEQ